MHDITLERKLAYELFQMSSIKIDDIEWQFDIEPDSGGLFVFRSKLGAVFCCLFSDSKIEFFTHTIENYDNDEYEWYDSRAIPILESNFPYENNITSKELIKLLMPYLKESTTKLKEMIK